MREDINDYTQFLTGEKISMENIYKIALAFFIIAIVFVSGISLLMYFVSQDLGGRVSLIKNSHDKIPSEILVEITADDFNRYPQLKELFENIDESRGEFVSTVSVQGKAIDEIMEKYKYKTLLWNGSYYDILVARS